MNTLTEIDMLDMCKDTNEMKVHKNYHITLHNVKIDESTYINLHQTNAINRLRRNNIMTYAQLARGKATHTIGCLALDIHNIYHSFPKWWGTFVNKTARQYDNEQHLDINVDINKWINQASVKASQIRIRLQPHSVNNSITRINNAYNIIVSNNNNPFT